jgi:transcriptional regulator with XRE-family HTH domain
MREKGGAEFRSRLGHATRRGLGQNIKDLRIARGMSQEKLAEEIQLTPKHLSQIEAGMVNVTINILTSIAATLSVGVGDLTPRRRSRGQQLLLIDQRDVDAIIRVAEILKRERGQRRRRPH